jgi:hypothetical protein
MDKDEISKYWREGWDAFWQAKQVRDCPYTPASIMGAEWISGYSSAADEAEADKDEFIMDFIDS